MGIPNAELDQPILRIRDFSFTMCRRREHHDRRAILVIVKNRDPQILQTILEVDAAEADGEFSSVFRVKVERAPVDLGD